MAGRRDRLIGLVDRLRSNISGEAAADLFAGDRAAGEQWVPDYTANCYHRSCDRWSEDWDLAGAAQDIGLVYDIARELAFSDRWLGWKVGSELRAVRRRGAGVRALHGDPRPPRIYTDRYRR